MAKRQEADEQVINQPAENEDVPVAVEQPTRAVAGVLVEALVPMWGDNVIIAPGTRYHLPAAAAEYLAGLGFVAIQEGD